MNEVSFETWKLEVLDLLREAGFGKAFLQTIDWDAWGEYYFDGYSAADTVQEELSYMT